MADDVKLTVRLPERLHAALRARARTGKRSVNREIVDALARGLAADDRDRTDERDAVTGLLVATGMWEPGRSWGEGRAASVPDAAGYAALRQAVGAVPALSDAIIEDRGPA